MTLWRRVGALVLGLLLALVLAEVGVRLWGGEARMMAGLIGRTTADLPVHRPSADRELLYELRPSLQVTVSTAEAKLSPEEAPHADDPRVMATNAFGFRDEPRSAEKPPGVLRILCLGGSNTYGAAVSQGRSWPAQLQAVLRARGHSVEVWNLGVDGYQTRQKLALAERALRQWSPDVFLIQLANAGPRVILDGMQDDPVWLNPGALPDDLGVYAENLHVFPEPDSMVVSLLRNSALARTSLVAMNRIHRSTLPGGEHPDALVERAEARIGPQLATLIDEARPSTEFVFFVPPAGGWPPWMGSVDMPLIDARTAPNPGYPDHRLLHPGADTYRWYAEHLADQLAVGGCLDQSTVARCSELPRTRDRSPQGPSGGP